MKSYDEEAMIGILVGIPWMFLKAGLLMWFWNVIAIHFELLTITYWVALSVICLSGVWRLKSIPKASWIMLDYDNVKGILDKYNREKEDGEI